MVVERSYRGVSAADRQALRRRRLLDATLALWGDPDSPRVTMTGVCHEAGLTERYFYEAFANLDAALVAVVDEIAEEVQRGTITALSAAEGGPADRARAAITAFVEVLTSDPRKGRVALIESATLEATRGHRALVLRRFARMVSREARKLHGPGAWGEAQGAHAASMFVGGVAMLITSWLDGQLDSSPPRIVDAAASNFLITSQS